MAAEEEEQHSLNSTNAAPQAATSAVLKPSEPISEGSMRRVDGIDFNKHADKELTASELLAGMANMGFQASAVSEAARIIDGMVRRSDTEIPLSLPFLPLIPLLHHAPFTNTQSPSAPGATPPLPPPAPPSSWATPRTSSPPVYAPFSVGSCSTSTSPPS